MSTPRNKSQLPDGRRQLLELMQSIGFGRIESLALREKDPVLDPPPRVVREVKFGGENGPRPECDVKDFALKSQVVELFSEFDRLDDGVIEILTVKHGLPFTMHVVAATFAA